MVFSLLKIRGLQIKRVLQNLGLPHSFVVILLLIFASIVMFGLYKQKDTALLLSVTLVISIGLLHLSRPDKDFVFKQIHKPQLNMLSEYVLFTLPFTVLCLFTEQWYCFPLMLLALEAIVQLKFSIKRKTVLPKLTKLLPAKNFEWVSGIRKSYVFLTLYMLLAIATSWVRFFPLIPLWLFTSVVIGFYQECEPLHVLFANGPTPKQLLTNKLKSHCSMLVVVMVPVLFINSCFNPELAWINFLFLIIELALLIFSILLKYSGYIPNERLTGNNVLISLMCLCTLIPFLFPIPLIMSLRNYSRAKNNLNIYFL